MKECVRQLYSGVGSAMDVTDKSLKGSDTHYVCIPPVNFPGITLDTDGHIRGGESEQSDTW